ncbi:DJ-1/PfpI family protein [Paenibacillus sp. GCM10012307]|uniref:DJ-1/PfpI family protein n=1 Tax=Paenibacillus roseus TaxID=2798579 RepID=A0A934J0C3_9BACL|nr:DJ-1/PfpI family protein [Paenibacillus roseus]MBJ6362521.1 DJ-1/PfpI family protein [Paenibacillus roseus]
MKPISVGILLFDDADTLDFVGPLETFALVQVQQDEHNFGPAFRTFTFSLQGTSIKTAQGVTIIPDYSESQIPPCDILIVPGGPAARRATDQDDFVKWLRHTGANIPTVAAVCTGAFLLAHAGLLHNKKATTHWLSIDQFRAQFPDTEIIEHVKFVDEGNLITSGGISSGINMALHIIEQRFGKEVATRTARILDLDLSCEW